ncbi:Maf family protein [Meridianimarinicoccus aquatilis]|uniref:dTTP/UTP pyrophosphatase n=1 Tax=Meridianimarinicoccus aquatilis TaxID=2552766 RepID=A0A4R6AYI0_9RHOB|nr:nucleoside triphosphate pyrophosphatase [Fluviibacterium aquatile]QIE42627.1 septum formation protein Maf [Rhodobacteraceae bacterium SC52]TDL87918.1 septum formation protein Maf [Fluviibacterium aquatile]
MSDLQPPAQPDGAVAPRLVLGSGSPRRLELLGVLGITPDAITPPDINEDPRVGEVPRVYCARIAREKAAAVIAGPDDIILCADTTVAMGRRIMGKPADAGEAASFLLALSGRRHRVITAVCVRRGARIWQREVESRVQMKSLSDEELNAYLSSGDWQGKAGGYGIQGPAGAFIPWTSGSFTAIVGLPLAETATLLTAAGFPVWQRVAA